MMVKQPYLLIALCFCWATDIHAAQFVLGRDGAEIAAKISAGEVSRIVLEGDRITRIAGTPAGVVIEHDATKGDVFIGAAAGQLDGPVNMFVTSELGATYQLLLQPVDVPSEQIVIRNPELVRDAFKENNKAPRDAEIAEIMRAVITGRSVRPYRRIGSDPLWLPPSLANGDVYVKEAWRGGNWDAMVLAVRANKELEIKPHMLKPAVAVWLERSSLAKGETMRAIVIRNRYETGEGE